MSIAHRDTDRHWDEATVRFRRQTIGLLAGRWHVLTAATVVSHLSLYVVFLLLALRHMGVSDAMVGWAQVLGIFALTRLVTARPVTPGGLGLVELALTAGLVIAGGLEPRVAVAVLIFCVLTLFVQVPIEAACYAWWRVTEGRRTGALQLSSRPAGVS